MGWKGLCKHAPDSLSLSAMARVTSGMSGGFHIGAPSKIDLKIPCSEGSESQSDTCAPSMHWETRLSKAAKFLAGTRNFCKGVLTVICIWSTAHAFSIKVGKHDISIFCQFNAKSGIQRAFGMFRPQDLGYPTVSFWSIPIDVGRQGKTISGPSVMLGFRGKSLCGRLSLTTRPFILSAVSCRDGGRSTLSITFNNLL